MIRFGAALAGLLVAVSVRAIHAQQVTGTAGVVCGYRAIASAHPDPKLRNPDHLADKICGRPAFLPQDYDGAKKQIDGSGPQFSAYYIVNVRTHYIDHALRKAAQDGTTQVVILGAGYDSRAYRFRESHPQMRFFEVDLPKTSESKQARLKNVFGAVPDYVRYAPIDFDRQKLEDVLPPLGYDPKQKTFFILEGVTMYVVEQGNAATLQFIRTSSAPGSRLVYDYIVRPVVEGKYEGYWAADTVAAAVKRRGEPYVTGWTPPEKKAFLAKNGLELVEDVGKEELDLRHNTGTDGKLDGRLLNWQRLVEARVP